MSASGTFPERRLSEVCEIVSGATPRRNHPEYWDGDIAWVTPKDIRSLEGSVIADTPEKITNEGYKSCSTQLLPAGSVLFSSRAPIGLVAVTGIEMCTNQGFKSLIPGPEVEAGYLYWCLRREGPKIAARSSGTTFSEISRKGMERVKIPLPPLPEQRWIAAILDKADAVRRKRQQTLDLADDFLRSAFLDLFGDPVTNPKGWGRLKLSDAVDLINGRAFKVSEWSDRGRPIIRIQNLKDRFAPFNYFDSKCSDRFNVEPGDLLLAWAGQLVSFGVHIWDGPAGLLNQHIFNVHPRVPFELEYLEFSLGQIVELAKGHFHGIEMKHLTKANLNQQHVLDPPQDLQRQFAGQVRKARATVKMLRSASAGQHRLAGSLTQRAFRGEL
ncbi:restriction endonuclease subunit S [Candidatus Bipolaricaulota bacterium]